MQRAASLASPNSLASPQELVRSFAERKGGPRPGASVPPRRASFSSTRTGGSRLSAPRGVNSTLTVTSRSASETALSPRRGRGAQLQCRQQGARAQAARAAGSSFDRAGVRRVACAHHRASLPGPMLRSVMGTVFPAGTSTSCTCASVGYGIPCGKTTRRGLKEKSPATTLW